MERGIDLPVREFEMPLPGDGKEYCNPVISGDPTCALRQINELKPVFFGWVAELNLNFTELE